MLFDQAAHDQVVRVGIYAKIADETFAETEAPGKRASCLPVRRDAVDGAIGFVIFPRAVLNEGIGGVFPDAEHEDSADPAAFFLYKQLPQGNVLQQHPAFGVVGAPLEGIAVLRHPVPGGLIDGQDAVHILFKGRAYHMVSSVIWFDNE